MLYYKSYSHGLYISLLYGPGKAAYLLSPFSSLLRSSQTESLIPTQCSITEKVSKSYIFILESVLQCLLTND